MCVAFSFLTSSYSVAIAPGMEDARSDDQDRCSLFLMSTQTVKRGRRLRCPHTVVDVRWGEVYGSTEKGTSCSSGSGRAAWNK